MHRVSPMSPEAVHAQHRLHVALRAVRLAEAHVPCEVNPPLWISNDPADRVRRPGTGVARARYGPNAPRPAVANGSGYGAPRSGPPGPCSGRPIARDPSIGVNGFLLTTTGIIVVVVAVASLMGGDPGWSQWFLLVRGL